MKKIVHYNILILHLFCFCLFKMNAQYDYMITQDNELFSLPFNGYATVLGSSQKEDGLLRFQIEYGISGASILSIDQGVVSSIYMTEDSVYKIDIQTSNDYFLTYSGISKINNSIKAGSIVNKGDIIGFQGKVINPESYTNNYFGLKIKNKLGESVIITQIPSLNWTLQEMDKSGCYSFNYKKRVTVSLNDNFNKLCLDTYKPIKNRIADMWYVIKKSNGLYCIYSAWNGKAISYSDKDSITLQKLDINSKLQEWNITSVNSANQNGFIVRNEECALCIKNSSLVFEKEDSLEYTFWDIDKVNLDLARKSKILSPLSMKNDIEFLFDTLEAIHPNLYYKYDKQSFVNIRNESQKRVETPLSLNSFLLTIAQNNYFFDGHTNVDFSNLFISKRLYTQKLFKIDKEGNLLYYDKDLDTYEDVKSVNGITATDAMKIFTSLYSEDKFTQRKDANLFLNIFFTPPYEVTLSDGRYLNCEEYLKLEHLFTFDSKKLGSLNTRNYFNFNIVKDTIAVLYYNSCSELTKKQSKIIQNSLDSIFNIIKEKKIDNVVIDISKNRGGEVNNYRFFSDKIGHGVSDDSISFYKKKEMNDFIPNGSIITYEDDKYVKGLFPIENTNNSEGYNGNVYVLIGSQTFSTATLVAQWFRSLDVGVLIGEESGGKNPSFGGVIKEYLPNSNIALNIGTIEYMSQAPVNRGIIPDIYWSDTDLGGYISDDKIVEIIKEGKCFLYK